jgi:hypothetical protein
MPATRSHRCSHMACGSSEQPSAFQSRLWNNHPVQPLLKVRSTSRANPRLVGRTAASARTGDSHGYRSHHASHHRSYHFCSRWRLVRPGALVLSDAHKIGSPPALHRFGWRPIVVDDQYAGLLCGVTEGLAAPRPASPRPQGPGSALRDCSFYGFAAKCPQQEPGEE